MKKVTWVITFALAISAAPSFAGGTLSTDQLVSLMQQKPAVYDALKKSVPDSSGKAGTKLYYFSQFAQAVKDKNTMQVPLVSCDGA